MYFLKEIGCAGGVGFMKKFEEHVSFQTNFTNLHTCTPIN